jgi:hypothetical protein
MASFAVSFTFPELPGGYAYQQVRAEAGNFDTAVSRAFKEVKKRKGVKGRRITTVKIAVVKVTETTEDTDE